jgi:hypothetical protein
LWTYFLFNFPKTSQKLGCGFPIAKIGVIFSLATGASVALCIDVLNTHDIKLARQLYQYSQDHHPAGSWVSPRIFDSGVRADLPRDYDQNPISTFYETLKTRESSTREIWICSGNSQMGD